MRKPYSLESYCKAVLAVSEVNLGGNHEETRTAVVSLTRQAVLMGLDPNWAVDEFKDDLEDIADGTLSRRGLRFAIRTVTLMREGQSDHVEPVETHEPVEPVEPVTTR